jgi:hypothetical protein
VTGVFTDAPSPSHIDAGFILSAGSASSNGFFGRQNDLVSNNMFYTYFLLKPVQMQKNGGEVSCIHR